MTRTYSHFLLVLLFNNKLTFEIKGGYKLELKILEALKLLGSTKQLIGKTKNREKVPNLEVVK